MQLTGVCALIPAAGRGARFGAAENKVFAPLLGRPVLGWTLQAFSDSPKIDHILLIGSSDDLPRLRELGEQYGGGKVAAVVEGGANRQASVYRGLLACPDAKYIVVHDGARPCIQEIDVSNSVRWMRNFDALTWAVPVTDTLVRQATAHLDVDQMGDSVSRDGLWAIQTPQAFHRDVLLRAHEAAISDGISGTDDAGLVHRLGVYVAMVRSSPRNVKVTYAQDLDLAEAYLSQRKETTLAPVPAPPSFRIGNGYDVHRFVDGRKLFLGGVEFPEAKKGLLGHSDADVVLHAVCDALLGAAGLGDIGVLFPPSDDRHKDRPSIEFLQVVKARLNEDGWNVSNVDVTILAETPKIGPRAAEMKAVIAAVLNVATDQVGIKATTNEGMGFVGRGEGIAAHASALLMRA